MARYCSSDKLVGRGLSFTPSVLPELATCSALTLPNNCIPSDGASLAPSSHGSNFDCTFCQPRFPTTNCGNHNMTQYQRLGTISFCAAHLIFCAQISTPPGTPSRGSSHPQRCIPFETHIQNSVATPQLRWGQQKVTFFFSSYYAVDRSYLAAQQSPRHTYHEHTPSVRRAQPFY